MRRGCWLLLMEGRRVRRSEEEWGGVRRSEEEWGGVRRSEEEWGGVMEEWWRSGCGDDDGEGSDEEW
jgi:hypothetical protein